MTAQNVVSVDIFEGADKVEILGRLPALLWAYIDSARKLMEDWGTSPDATPASMGDVTRLLDVLECAADQLDNKALKALLVDQLEALNGFKNGTVTVEDVITSVSASMPKLEELAGQRRDVPEGLLERETLNEQIEKMERIKAGRSADIVISIEILNDVKDFLANEVMTEGISSVLVIDNAGTLICNIGDNLELDVISLAAVAAANFAATEQIARLIGEREFVLLFYKGHNESFHFSRVGDEYIIVTIFNNSLSLGLLRLKIAEVAQVLEKKLPKRQG